MDILLVIVWDIQAGKNAPGTPCPSGHSMNYCSGWEVGSRLLANELIVTDPSYKTAQDTAIDITCQSLVQIMSHVLLRV
jgi:hypothetical protein